MSIFTRSLWPATEQNPYRRFGIAVIAAPFIWGSLGAVAGFLLGGMTEPTGTAAIDYTIDVALVSYGLMFGFTFTLGLIGMAILWSASQRGAVVWAVTGGLMGAFMATMNSLLSATPLDRTLMILFVFLGWSVFLTIRWLAGIREDIIDDAQ